MCNLSIWIFLFWLFLFCNKLLKMCQGHLKVKSRLLSFKVKWKKINLFVCCFSTAKDRNFMLAHYNHIQPIFSSVCLYSTKTCRKGSKSSEGQGLSRLLSIKIKWNDFLSVFCCKVLKAFWFPSILVAPAAEQSDLSSGFSVCLFVCLLGCLNVDREFNFNY